MKNSSKKSTSKKNQKSKKIKRGPGRPPGSKTKNKKSDINAGRPRKAKRSGKKKEKPSLEVALRINGIELDQIETMAQFGLVNSQIASILKISESSLYNYIKEYPELDHIIKRGKTVADLEVDKSLYKSACGYSYTERKMKYAPAPQQIKNPDWRPGSNLPEFIENPNRNPVLIEVSETVKQVQPNPVSIVFWKINRSDWRRGDLKSREGELSNDEFEALRTTAAQLMAENI